MPIQYSVTDINFMSDLNELMDSLTAETPEPSVELRDSDNVLLMSIKASGIEYNRNTFPYDTYEKAAKRIYESIKPKSDDVKLDLTFDLSRWSEFPQRNFSLSKAGLEHNFDVDTWHWWLLNELERIVKRTPS